MKKTTLATGTKGSLIFVFILLFCSSAILLLSFKNNSNNSTSAFDGTIMEVTQGTGEAGDPYLISTEGQLAFLIDSIENNNLTNWNSKHYKLTNNLNLNNVDIGMISSLEEKSFSGIFDGNNKTISNINISTHTDSQIYGLFGFISGGTIKNLNIFNLSANFINQNGAVVGGIAGKISNGATIENCSVSSSKIAAAKGSGGIVGILSGGTIKDSQTLSSNLNSQITSAGITAQTTENNNSILNCTSTNNNILAQNFTIIAGVDSVAAGIIATSTQGYVYECISSDNTIMAQRYAAGLVGVAHNTEIEKSYNTSMVRGLNGIDFENNTAPKGSDGVEGVAGSNGVDGKSGENGINGGTGGSAGGLVCMLDFNSLIKDSFNAGQIVAGMGGNGGNGGVGGNGGNAVAGNGNGGAGGAGGNGGNGGAGGSAGALFVYFINNDLSFEFVYNKITNSFTKPDMVSLGIEDGNNSGVGGIGGMGGLGGQGINNGKNGLDGASGHRGDNGSVIELKNSSNIVIQENTPKILFDYNGGTELDSFKTAQYNQSFGALPSPTKTNAEFIGWNTKLDGTGQYLNSNTLFLFLSDITLYAQYSDLLVITLDLNFSGSSQQTQPFRPETQIYNQLTSPSRQGWAFDGWFIDSACLSPLNSTTTAQQLITNNGGVVYAKWLQEIQIYFNVTEGGSLINTEPAGELNNWQAPAQGQNYVVRVSERSLGSLPTASPSVANNSAYFGGWYENLADTNTLVAATTIYEYANLTGGKITLTSRWNTNAFLEYNLMGGDGIDECSPVWDGSSHENYAGGNGTQSNPYQIANANQLRRMARDINANTSSNPINKTSHFILTNNIDLGGFAWTPIGTGSGSGSNTSRFEGNFNGNGFYIKNLNVSKVFTSGTVSSKNFMGLFGAAYNAKISRVGIESGELLISIKGTATFPSATKIYIGSVIGYCAGATVIDQCYNNASITVDVDRAINVSNVEAYVGGLIGRLDDGSYEGWGAVSGGSTFKDSYNNGNIKSYFNYNQNKVYNFVGGIIGYVYRSDFLNVFNMASIDIKTNSTNSNSSSNGSTIAFAGGICGEINSRGSLTNSFNTGSVSAQCFATGSGGGDKRAEVGGVVAHLNNTISADSTISINGCKNYGDLNLDTNSNSQAAGGGRDLGGIIGLIVGGTSSPIVSGNKNFYKANAGYYGICSYSNGSRKTTSSNGNNLVAGTINLNTTASNNAYGSGDFEFTKTSYFYNDTYFSNTNGNIKWDFESIWEFRLDRNDNLPMLKYMSYLTEFDNGVVTPNRKYVYSNQRVGRLITPTKTDFIFSGWWNVPVQFDSLLGCLAYNGIPAIDGQNGFILYVGKSPNSLSDQNSTVFTGVDNIQIYAGWMPEASAITVALSGIEGCIIENTQTPAPSTIEAYQDYELRQLYTPQKDGYTFAGWWTEENIQYFDTTVYDTNQSITLTARWQPNGYIINLDANGGYAFRDSCEVTFDLAVEALPIPYFFGRTFLGWQAPDSSIIDNNTIYRYPSDITLTALWQLNDYEITFDNNSDSVSGTITGTMLNQSFEYGQTKQLSTNNFQLEGYTFVGWALTSAIGNSAVYANNASFTMSTEGNKTLYAVWKAKSYFVRINTEGGSIANPNNLIREGAAGQRIPLPDVTKAGFDLAGWYISNKLGDDILITNSYVTIQNSDIDVYCVWIEKQFYINFNRNDTSGSTSATGTDPAGQIAQVSNPIAQLNSNTYSRVGYTFGGWAISPDGAMLFEDNDPLLITQQLHNAATGALQNQITLYAVWNPLPFVVLFDSNATAIGRESDGSMQNQIFYFDQIQKINQNEFIIIGHTFIGWATSSQNAVNQIVEYLPNAQITLTSQIGTLYAVWTKTIFEIQFRSGNQIWGETQLITFEDIAQPLMANPFSKARNVFVGWGFEPASDSSFMSLKIEEAQALKADANNVITLYAVWAAKTYDLKVYKDDSMLEYILMENIKYGEPTAFDSNRFEKLGYEFLGLGINGTLTVSAIGFIVINEAYFANEFTETPTEMVAMHNPLAVEIIGISQTSIIYKNQTTVTVLATPQIDGLTFSITSGSVNINSTSGEITLNAQDMTSITFTVLAQHTNGSSDTETFVILVDKRILRVTSFDSDFTYNGTQQTINYATSGKADGDNITTTLNTSNTFKNAGTYLATVVLTGGWDTYYEFDESCNFEVSIKQTDLIVIGNNTSRSYYTNNPTFASSFEGFVAGENEINLLITVQYSTLASKQSRAGTYTITQNILPLQNYKVTYQNGTLTVLPAELLNASVALQVGDSGYVEGGKLYFDLSDISFGVEGEFSEDDYSITWEWSDAPDGTWTAIDSETTNQLILTKYKLGMDVSGLYFRVRLTGTGNISSSQNVTSTVDLTQQIQPPAVVPLLSQNVLITLGVLMGFALCMVIVAIIAVIRSKFLIKRIKADK